MGLDVLRITYYCDRIKGIDIIDAGLGITPKVGAAFADLNVTCGASENYKEDVIIEQVRIKEGTAYTYGGYTPKMIAIASSVRTAFGVSKGEIVSTILERQMKALPVKPIENSVLSQYYEVKGNQLETGHLTHNSAVEIHPLKSVWYDIKAT